MDSLYTEEVSKLMYEAKSRLPADFPLTTREIVEGPAAFIVIVVELQYFNYRTVEDRLEIAMTLERLKTLVQETGIGCEIEKA